MQVTDKDDQGRNVRLRLLSGRLILLVFFLLGVFTGLVIAWAIDGTAFAAKYWG